MRSVSGIRGIVGESLTPDVVVRYVKAFLEVTGARSVVLGRDTRPTGDALEQLVAGICRFAGVDVIHLGVATTPTVEVMVEELKAGGGIILTASHNPIEWNALKFLRSDGTFPGPEEVEKIFALVDADDFSWPQWSALGKVSQGSDANSVHVRNVTSIPQVDVEMIRQAGFRVAVDSVNGAGYEVLPMLLRELGCEVVEIHNTPDGKFPRGAEPLPENLKDLSATVVQNQCNLGLALDPDADRCALVDENGIAIGEEYTLPIAVDEWLTVQPGPVTVNLSSSRMTDDVAESHGCEVFRSKVGEINVSLLMKANGSVIGGEGNGGVILPSSHYGRDSVVAAVLVLQWMARRKQHVSDFVKNNPAYTMIKTKHPLSVAPDDSLYDCVAEGKAGELDRQDGVRISRGKSWVHLRASNTEPIMRIIAEAPDQEEAEALIREFSEDL